MNASATTILDVIDNAIYLMDKAEESGACRFSLHNQALLLRADCFAFARAAGDPFARSFEMRAEEIEQMANRYLLDLRHRTCAPQAACDCAAMLATA